MSGRRRQTSRDAGRPDPRALLGSLSPVLLGLAVVAVIAIGFAGWRLLDSDGSGDRSAAVAAGGGAGTQQKLPSFVTSGPARVREAYTFIAAGGDEATFIPCYCGCGEHSGHRWIRDCFVKDWTSTGVVFDRHGADCDICVTIALTLKKGLADGQKLASIRKGIDARYGELAPPTDTPLPLE